MGDKKRTKADEGLFSFNSLLSSEGASNPLLSSLGGGDFQPDGVPSGLQSSDINYNYLDYMDQMQTVPGSSAGSYPLRTPSSGLPSGTPLYQFSTPLYPAAAGTAPPSALGDHEGSYAPRAAAPMAPMPTSSSSSSSAAAAAAPMHQAPPMANVTPLTQNCGEVYAERVAQLAGMVRNVGYMQSQMHLPISPPDTATLSSMQNDLRQQIEELGILLSTWVNTINTDPMEQIRAEAVRHELNVHAKQLELLQRELEAWQPNAPPTVLAALVLAKHPFPRTVFKDKKIQEDVELRLLSTAKAEVRVLGLVRAFIINEELVKGGGSKTKATPFEEVAMDENGVATFRGLVFKTGTGVRKVKMQFEVTVEVTDTAAHGTTEAIELRSDFSEPLIVMTHRSQWEEAEGMMLKYDAFRGPQGQQQVQIPWPAFGNALQRHYYRITTCPRPLSNRDLSFLHSKFNYAQDISLNDFDNFWKWFSKVSKQVHLQKNCPLWQKGYLFGFISKKEANELLRNEEDGTFVVRFSEKNSGQFAIAYVRERAIHHYLLTPDDQNKPLTEFLHQRATCQNIVKVVWGRGLECGTELITKTLLIEEFTNPKGKKRRDNVVTIEGYELGLE